MDEDIPKEDASQGLLISETDLDHFDYFQRDASFGVLVLGTASIFYWFSARVHDKIMRSRYALRRTRKQAEKVTSKAAFADYLATHPMPQEKIDAITSRPFVDLVECLKHGELTVDTVLLAFQHKAFAVDKLCNCVIEFLHPDLSEINLKGPLAGVPISLKDNFCVKGSESYAGMAHFLTGPSKEDAVLVDALKSLGAVPFVRTNVPQAMFSVLSSNPIDGTTLNPLDLTRSPAGSSSGEAALIGGGGSVLGFGTDLGGSIRLPAAMCNIVGFKPTAFRLSQRRMFTVGRFATAHSCCGPLARDVQTCMTAMEALFNSPQHHELDYLIPPIGYSVKQIPQNRPLRIGYFTYDGSFTPVPAAQRAVLHVKERLANLGHELVPWQPPFSGSEWLFMFLTAISIGDGRPLCDPLKYDVMEPGLATTLKYFGGTRFQRYLMRLWLRWTGNLESLSFSYASEVVRDIPSLTAHVEDLRKFRQCIYDHWNEAKLDAIICPAFGMAAPISVRTTRKFTGMLSYLNFFNIANMPAGCLPSGIRVTEEDIRHLKSDYMESSLSHKAARDLQMDSLGFPVSVQVAAAPWRDELCLHVMQVVENAVRI